MPRINAGKFGAPWQETEATIRQCRLVHVVKIVVFDGRDGPTRTNPGRIVENSQRGF